MHRFYSLTVLFCVALFTLAACTYPGQATFPITYVKEEDEPTPTSLPPTPTNGGTVSEPTVWIWATLPAPMPTATPVATSTTPAPTLGSGATAAPTITPAATFPPIPTLPPTSMLTPTPCAYTWFVQTQSTALTCPFEPPVISFAAAQYFQGGTMIWIQAKGLYLILPYNADKQPLGLVHFILDPLTIYRDTSSEFTPPPGLYAPFSGFGYVWRGDIFPATNSDGSPINNTLYRDILGWGLAPEFGYETPYQCGSGPTIYQICYLYYPDGRLIHLDMARGAISLWAWFFEE